MTRPAWVLLTLLLLAGAGALSWYLWPEAAVPPEAVGVAPTPVLVLDSPRETSAMRWQAPVGLVGVAVQGLASHGRVTLDLGGGPIETSGDFVWLDEACGPRTVGRRNLCTTDRIDARWHGPRGVLTPVYAGTRVFWRSLGPRALELLRAYGVAPIAPAPASLEGLGPDDVLVVPHAHDYETEAKVIALGPPAGGQRTQRSISSLRTHARLGPSDEGARVLLEVGGVPVLLEDAGGVRATVDVVATVEGLRFGWADGAADADGNGEIQPRDRFPGLTQADVATPRTDELVEAILAHIVGDGPRVSPVPLGAPALLVLTADQDYAPEAAILAQSHAADGVGMTFLLTTPGIGRAPDVTFSEGPRDLPSRTMVLELAARGHSVGIHPFVGPQTQAVTSEVAERFAALYGVGPRIVRNHHVTWLPVGEAASVQGRAGLRLGLDYIAQSTQGADLGFMGGTGVPMTYPATPVLHLPTQLDDHVLLPARFGYRPYDAEQLVQKSASVLDVAARHGSVIVANHHPIWWIETDGAWQRGLIGAARERSIPIWGAARYLRYAHGYREPVLWRSAQGWMALVPETGLTVVLGGERYALRPGVHKVAHQK